MGNQPVVCKDQEKFLTKLEGFIEVGHRFGFSVPKTEPEVLEKVKKIFSKHKVQINILQDSEPEVVEYISEIFLQSSTGAALGGIAALNLYPQLYPILKGGEKLLEESLKQYIGGNKEIDIVVPGLGTVISVGAGIGAFIGAFKGYKTVEWNLKTYINHKPGEEEEQIVFDMYPQTI
ncbi:MAG: hypothetical protein F6K23_35795 [Okeania sp. SIO2C9]|uniref:hypothetical protein n=1 Tax=Okeania sp. SIO2C9 TaxID=2607791 RepID=UPI0013C29A00|nr:hypothetical protein [Okeania sp. SIO2C9]NEQ77905.1 hypothetical protein [Okeania sp. SIO2C9]